MKTISNTFIYGFVISVVWTLLFFFLENNNGLYIGQIATVLLLINVLILILKAIKARNALLLIIFVFMVLYIWPAKLFFFDKRFFSAHNIEYTYYTAAFVTLLFLLFSITLLFFVKFSSPLNYQRIQHRSNDFLFWGIYIIALLILLVFKRSGSLYDKSGDDVVVSSLYEYDLILFLILYIYTNGETIKIRFFYLLCLAYAFFTIIAGGRIEIVLLGFLLLSIKLQYSIPFKRFMFLLILAIWGMSTFETVRGNPMILFTNDIIDIVNPFVEKETFLDCQISNEGDVYWSSERMIILVKEGIINLEDRFLSVFYYLTSSFLPTSVMPPIANLANYRIDLYTTGGGGMAIAYFYVMFGLLGVVSLGFFFSYMLNLLYKKISPILLFYIILMITTYARWFVYNPIHLVKFCVWGTFCFFIVTCLDHTIKKYRRNTIVNENNN